MPSKRQTIIASLVLCMLAPGCSSPSETVALGATDRPEAVAFATPTAEADEGTIEATEAPSASVGVAASDASRSGDGSNRCGTDWLAIARPVFEEMQADTALVVTEQIADSCRSEAPTAAGRVSVLLEPTTTTAVVELVEARASATSFMGFEELEFLTTDSWASSSLVHVELDRLVENRWVSLDAENAIRIEVAVDGDAAMARADLLPHIDVLERDATAYQQAGNAEQLLLEETWSNNDSAVEAANALADVLDHVSRTVLLGPLATPQGADAIAFEYAFPENFAALATAHRPTDCGASDLRAVCELHGADATYTFTFARIDGAWLLDDFAIAT